MYPKRKPFGSAKDIERDLQRARKNNSQFMKNKKLNTTTQSRSVLYRFATFMHGKLTRYIQNNRVEILSPRKSQAFSGIDMLAALGYSKPTQMGGHEYRLLNKAIASNKITKMGQGEWAFVAESPVTTSSKRQVRVVKSRFSEENLKNIARATKTPRFQQWLQEEMSKYTERPRFSDLKKNYFIGHPYGTHCATEAVRVWEAQQKTVSTQPT